MRKLLRMTFVKYTNTKGYMGHWEMNYYVDNVIDLKTNELICPSYVFKGSTIFKGMGLKIGDTIEMSANIEYKMGKLKISYYKNVKRV